MIDIKSDREIDMMRKGGKILASILKEAKKFARPGVSTKGLDNFIENSILKSGAQPSFKNFHGFPASSCISINEELVHALPSEKKIKSGDVVGIDVGVSYLGYHSDAAITVGIGTISKEARNLIQVTKKALLEGIKLITPGNRLSLVQKKMQHIIENAGYSVIRNLTGHGIGKNLQEKPEIPNYYSPKSDFVFKKGMTFCLEPMVAIGDYRIKVNSDGWTVVTRDGSLTAHFEHTLSVNEKGCEILTKALD